jgi:DNA-binding response OmpR family regulator
VLYLAVDRLKSQGLLMAKINDDIMYDFFSKSFLHTNGEITVLTKNEIHAMELLIHNRAQVIPYEVFSNTLEDDMSDGALKNLILRLRKKMGDDSNLKNLSKIGYKLV